MIGFNGGLIGKKCPIVTTASMPGVWTLNEQSISKRDGIWPSNFNPVQNFMNANMTTVSNGTALLTGGTPFWIDITNASSFDYFGGALQKAMDGSLSTFVYWVGSDYPQGGITRIRLELVPRILPAGDLTSLRLHGSGFSGYTTYIARLLDSSKNLIAGTSVNTSIAKSWVTVPITGDPYYLEIVPAAGIYPRLYLFAIEVNGVILVDT